MGKAKSLRKRLSSYFQPSRKLRADAKLRALIKSIEAYEILPVKSEAEALLLESRLIKQYHPRYNVDLRDDKRFLHICLDLATAFPRLELTRLRKEDGRLYFGPFPRAGALRDTVHFLAHHFGLRTCRPRVPDETTKAHCLSRAIKACSCPCSGDVTTDEYNSRVQATIAVLQGETEGVIEHLETEMMQFAAQKRFEDAARVRDSIENLKGVCVRNQRTFTRTDLTQQHPPPPDGIEPLREALGLAVPPDVIECFDISNTGGHLAVGSLVCFEAGKPARRNYRRYRIKSPEATDDTAMMREVVARHFTRRREEGRGLPDLVVVDGGKGQLSAAIEGLAAAEIEPIPILGLAKKQEEIFLPGQSVPITLPRHHQGLHILQAIRDEAHRFALGYHQALRRRRIADSVLAEIPGVGPNRQRALLKHFGSVRSLRRALPQAIADAVPGLGPILAQQICDFLHDRRPGHPSQKSV